MPSTINIKQMDQTSWVCYQLGTDSYYYGEVGYLDQSGIVQPKQNTQAANNPKNKIVKHGFGIYLSAVNQQTSQPEIKYQGFWDKDQKSGKGYIVYSNGLSYQGSFHEGHYHGSGKMVWPNGDTYQGNWKRSKMDGAGSFRKSDGQVLKGIFKNNYLIDQNVLRNPFLSDKQYAAFKKQRKQIIKQKQKQQKVKHGFVARIETPSIETLKQKINQSVSNNRVPLILSTKTSQYRLQNLLQSLNNFYGVKVNVFDLRKIYTLQGQQRWKYRQQIHQQFRQSLLNGQIFILNLDESEIDYKQMFYPDIKQFYDSNGFSSISWSRDQLKLKQVQRKIFGQNANQIQIHQNYKLIVWTKFKVENNLNEEFARQKLQIKFQKIIPFIKVDCLIVARSQNQTNHVNNEQ